MNTQSKKIIATASGAMLAASGAMAAVTMLPTVEAQAETQPTGITHHVPGFKIDSQRINLTGGDFKPVASVQGTFEFDQEGVTPSDELFNVFGAAILSLCSKPAPDLLAEQTGYANYYINVGGNLTKSFTLNLADLEEDEQEVLMGCSCATGSPFGQAAVLGVPLASVVSLADMEEGVNTLTAYGADGYAEPLPLQYALDKGAMLVYRVNGEELKAAEGSSSVQLWMPETVARYFTRNITSLELTREDTVPAVEGVDPLYRNKIELRNTADNCVFVAGDQITFEGVADDCGSPVEAIEFSFDDGESWTVCETEGATADKWVNWRFTTTFDDAGSYEMTVRARTADGTVSPLSASLAFEVVS